MKSAKQLLCLALFCLPICLTAQSELVGDWTTELPGPEGNLVKIQVTFQANGTYQVDLNLDGSSDIQGKYEISGDQISIQDDPGDNACDEKGVYKFSTSGNQTTLERINDGCTGRGGPDGKMIFTRK